MNRRAPAASLLLALAVQTSTAADAGNPDHQVVVTAWPERGRLEATDRVTIDESAGASFTLAPGLSLTAVLLDGRPVDFSRSGRSWHLGEVVRPGQEIAISYVGELPTSPGEAPFLGGAGGFLPAGAGWLPDLGTGPVTFDLTVRVPKPYVAVATGDLVSEEEPGAWYQAVFRSDRSGEPPSLFVGPYVIEEQQTADARIRTHFYADQADLAPRYLAQAADYLSVFAGRIGDYPYRDFHVVAAPIPVGLGFPGLTYVARQILHLPFMQTRSLAHEILHSWWGGAVAVDAARGNWAEGLITYMADYGLVAAADPDQARAMRLEWLRDFQALPEGRDVPLRAFVTRQHDAAQVVGYNKAAFLFHMLDQRAGSAGFDAAIQRFWRRNQGGAATWSDLEAVFSDTLGVDLSRFFEQWVERAGAPRLRLLQATAQEVDQGYQVSLQIRQDEPAYELRLPIAIETDQGVRRLEAAIDSLEAEVTLVTEARPLAVTVDPDYDVFRYLAPSEAPPILRDVTLSEHGLMVIPSGSQEFQRLADELAGRMMDGQAEVVPQDDPRIGAAPLLVIGPTDEVRNWLQRSALPPTPEQLIGRGDARVWTMRRDDASAILVVEADDAASLRALLRPLPHYGRSSYLIFEGAELIEQGVWPPGENPLRKLLGGRP